MNYPVCKYGDAVLREKAEPIREVTPEIRQLARDMVETMHAERGVGLAAQQVGKPLSLCVIDVPAEYDVDDNGVRVNPGIAMPLVLINPDIVRYSAEKQSGEEGCLSFPGLSAPVERSMEVTVNHVDLSGRDQQLTARGFLARAVQHEVDHLNGVLLVDRMSAIKKIALAGQLKRLKRETQQQLASR